MGVEGGVRTGCTTKARTEGGKVLPGMLFGEAPSRRKEQMVERA